MVSTKKARKSSESKTATTTPSTPTTTTSTTTTSTTSSSLIDSHVSSLQAQKAFSALSSYISKRNSQSTKNELPLDSTSSTSDQVFLQITVKKLDKSKMMKPIRIPLKHSLHDQSSLSVCLLVKDPQREYKDLLTTLNIKLIERVVGVSKLKGKFKAFDARRQLLQDHDLFLADDRILPLLPKLLGKKWFDAKKQPVSISLTRPKKLKEEIERAISSTYYIQNKGSCSSIKIGSLSLHTPSQLVDNLSESLPKIVSRIPGGWSNVQGIDIKTSNSIALPIWNCKLGEAVDDETSRWNGMEIKEINEDDSEDQDEDDDEEEEEEGEDDEEEVETIHISKLSNGKGKGKDKGDKSKSKVISSISKDVKVKANGSNGKVGKKEKVLKAVKEVPEAKTKTTSISEEKPKKNSKKIVQSNDNDSGASAATKKKLAGLKKLEKKA